MSHIQSYRSDLFLIYQIGIQQKSALVKSMFDTSMKNISYNSKGIDLFSSACDKKMREILFFVGI